jgi:hypothetical protein
MVGVPNLSLRRWHDPHPGPVEGVPDVLDVLAEFAREEGHNLWRISLSVQFISERRLEHGGGWTLQEECPHRRASFLHFIGKAADGGQLF